MLTSTRRWTCSSRVAGTTERAADRPGAVAIGAAGALPRRRFGCVHKRPPLCRAMARTMLHGHRYDGSRAERELGLTYTPARDTLRRTVEWAIEKGLIRPRAATA